MEKLVCALWAGTEPREIFNARLMTQLPNALQQARAYAIRLNLRDKAVEDGQGIIQRWQAPQQDAIVQFWLPSANACFRGDIDALLQHHCDRFAAWLVAESSIIANHVHPAPDGQRTQGWSQASFITFRPDLTWKEAVHFWHGHHTRVAVETQANFEYIQNIIVRALTNSAPAYDAFVEECFPLVALEDRHAFFDAVGDDEKFSRNTSAMLESCTQFLDFSRIDVMPTSQFNFALEARKPVP